MDGSTCVNIFNCTYMYVVLFFRCVHISSQHICYGEKMFHTKVVSNNETHLLSVHFFMSCLIFSR